VVHGHGVFLVASNWINPSWSGLARPSTTVL
jgi:hypothetical protein